MDMTDMSDFADRTFDVVLDKGCMDAALAGAGDVWNPNLETIRMAYKALLEISRILRPDGVFIQISLAQPHFRKKYLLGQHPTEENQVEEEGEDYHTRTAKYIHQTSCPFGWDCRVEEVGSNAHCFSHFMYVMTKT
jgi:EEF1A lysine methyltransferase 4